MIDKNIEELLQELEAVKGANQKKNDFLQRMSHEIRTPLNAIIGLSYLSKESETMPTKVYENLDKIEQSAQFLLSFVNDILSLSQLEAGKIALEYESVDAAAYLEELVQKAGKQAEAKQIHFSARVCELKEAYYVFDVKKLSKALYHLVESAVKSTPTGGMISLTVQRLAESDEEVKLCFEILDNGIGIEEELLEHVFEPFEHIYGESRTLYNGSGLELAIVKSIVDLMDGTIFVESRKGEGTRFLLTLNLKKERRKANRPVENSTVKPVYDFTGKRVLVVEDSDINIEIAKNILLHKHFEVEVALDGQQAVEAFQSHEAHYYDVILMDIRMPVMDGLEAARMIRTLKDRPDRAEIPIIAMTANAFEEDVRKSLEAGMNGHLSKPIDIKKMYALLHEVMN